MPSPDRVALAQQKLADRAHRIRRLRQRIVGSVLAAFVLAWGVVAFDGAMGAESTPVASTATGTTTTPSSSQATTSSGDDAAATMTTSQS
jgi:hypothetical protein